MDRAYQLSFCKQCGLREFSKHEGIICSLTNEKATFETECADYSHDERLAIQREVLEEEQLQSEKAQATMGLDTFGIKNGIAAGVIAMAGAVIWFFAGASIDIIFFYPPLLFTLGLIALVRGIKVRRASRKKRSNDLLDSEI